MGSIFLKNTLVPQPKTTRNFTTHLAYDAHTNSIAYPSGKLAIVKSLEDNSIKKFTGHGKAQVSVVRFCPRLQSNYVCSGDESGKVIVWSYSNTVDSEGLIETKSHAEFKVLTGPITDISWDAEGLRLCVVGEGRDRFGTFITWDTGNSLGEVSGHSARINACHFKQSRPMRAMTVGFNGIVVFYKGPKLHFASSDHTHHVNGSFVRDVRFSPGAGKYAVSVGSDRRIVVYDGNTGEFIKHIEDKTQPCGGLFALAWVDKDDASTEFVTASADGYIRLWDVESSKLIQRWQVGTGLSDQQVGITVTKNQEIVSLSLDGTISIFKERQEKPILKLLGHTKSITTLAVNPLVTASYDGIVFEWSPDNVPTRSNNHSSCITSIENYNGKTSTVSWDNTLKVSDEVQYQFSEQPKISHAHKGIVAIVTTNNRLITLDSVSRSIIDDKKLKESASVVALSSKYVIVAYETTNSIDVFSSNNLSDSFVMPSALRGTPSALSIDPSEELLAVGDTTGNVLLYELQTKNIKTSRWFFHTGKITSMAWRPNQEERDHIATVSLDTHIIIYSVKRPMNVIKKLNAHKDGINVVEWESADTIVTAGADSCINRWNVEFT